MKVYGYTEERWNDEISKNKGHSRSLIKKTDVNCINISKPQASLI